MRGKMMYHNYLIYNLLRVPKKKYSNVLKSSTTLIISNLRFLENKNKIDFVPSFYRDISKY